MLVESIVRKIDSLPPLSTAAQLIQFMYHDDGLENLNVLRFIKIIESDALLTANILRMVNTPYYGFSKKIASIAQAVSLFGIPKIYMLVVQYAMAETLEADISLYGCSNTQFNDICHLQSALMMQWYSHIELRDAQFISPLALIMESGKLVIAQEIGVSQQRSEFQEGFLTSDDTNKYEKDFIGVTSYFITGLLFEHWNLEPIYVEILKYLDSPSYYHKTLDAKIEAYIQEIDVIRTAINPKEILTDESIQKAAKKVEKLRHDREYFEKVAYRIRDAYNKKLEEDKEWFQQ